MGFSPKTDVGELFRKRLQELAANAKANAEAMLSGGSVSWYRPSELNKSFTTEDGNKQVHEVFSREQQEKWFDEVTKDRSDTGTYGDLAIVALQGDMLACMERAYRARHQSACQTRVYPAARLRGHGNDYGVITQGMLGYIQALDKINKGEIEKPDAPNG